MENKKEKLFELKGTLRFYAKDIEDAFRIIGEHYLSLSKGEDPDKNGVLGIPGTDIVIEAIEKEKKF